MDQALPLNPTSKASLWIPTVPIRLLIKDYKASIIRHVRKNQSNNIGFILRLSILYWLEIIHGLVNLSGGIDQNYFYNWAKKPYQNNSG